MNLRGIARPSASLISRIGRSHHIDIARILDEETAIDTLAQLLVQTIEAQKTIDGRIDMRAVAADVLAKLVQHQK